MDASPDHIVRVRRTSSRGRFVAPAALFVVATVMMLLWLRAIPATIDAIGTLTSGDAVVATVVTCDPGNAGGCTVAWPTDAGPSAERSYDEPGLFTVSPGQQVTVSERDGRVVQAGRPALAEAALVTLLAICFTGFTFSWWRSTLDSAPVLVDESPGVDG